MKRIATLLLLIAVAFTGRTVQAAEDGAAERPNILMIVTHDIGRHIGCYGVPTVHTPNLDRMAEQGRMFTRYYSTSAVCSPGRGSLHTGRYPQSNGLMGLTHGPWWWSLGESERHTAQILGDAGYETVLAGFNHIGNPTRLGYQKHVSPACIANGTVNAVAKLFAERTPDQPPLFVKAGFKEVHRGANWRTDDEKGVFVPGYLQDTPTMRADLAQFQGSIRLFDGCVGRMVEAVEKSAVADNTLIIFTSDHGIPYPGSKWSCREAGLANPLLMYQPDTVFAGGQPVTALMSNVDVLPTLLDHLRLPIPENMQGVSFMPYLQGQTEAPPRDAVFGQYTSDMKRDNLSRAICTERFYLIRYFDQGRSVAYPVDVDPARFAKHVERCPTRGSRPFAQLYDMENDPWQLTDLSRKPEYAETVKELSKQLLDWMETVDDPLLEGPLRTPYYDKAIEDLKSVGE